MKTILMFDDTGYIYLQISGSYRIPQGGIRYLEVEIPEGKMVKSIDTTTIPNAPIYDSAPLTNMDMVSNQLAVVLKSIIQ